MPDRNRAFGQAAVALGLITSEQLDELLDNGQRSERTGAPRTLEQLLLDRGWLSDSQRRQVLRALGEDPEAATLPHPAPPREEVSDAPSFLGPHPVSGYLGAGGMGEVLQVTDMQIGRELAAKLIRGDADPALHGKFVLEAQLTGQLEHPGIVPVHEMGMTDDGRPYFTMKRVAGRTLLREIRGLAEEPDPTARRRNLLRLLQIFLRVCDAVAFAHHQGVVHRDLKPENVMIGEFGEVQVMDWGLAKLVEEGSEGASSAPTRPASSSRLRVVERGTGGYRTLAGDVVGTPHYMPPEQASGQVDRVDRRSDVYSLGAILYEMLAYRMPFPGEDAREVLQDVLRGQLEPPSSAGRFGREVPRELEAVVTRAMAYRRRERYQTVEALREDVEAFLDGRLLAAASYTPGQLLLKWAARHKAAVAAAAGVLLAMVAAIVGISWQLRVARRERQKAVELSQEADRQRAVAVAQRATAERHLADFLSMSDIRRLEELALQADALGPQSWKLPAIERWLAEARAIEARAQQHAAVEERLRAKPELTQAERWQLGVVERLQQRLVAFSRRIGEVAGWPAEARRWRRLSLERRGKAWARARVAIAASARYGGLQLPPQEGLVPLGPDPESGLWEFLHLPSGKAPLRGDNFRWVVRPATGVVLVLLPGGSFRMGCVRGPMGPNQDPVAALTEGPVSEVRLAPFFISKYELTQAQWQRLAPDGKNPSHVFEGQRADPETDPVQPVQNVGWAESRRLVRRAGLALPTEAQWEYAARAGTTTPWWTGTDPRSLGRAANVADRTLKESGWQGTASTRVEDGFALTAPVGRLAPNPFGLHDVLGNVLEWCRDPYFEQAYRLPLAGEDGSRRWPSRKEVPFRVNRGGSWHYGVSYARASFRGRNTATYRSFSIGLRPVRRVIRD